MAVNDVWRFRIIHRNNIFPAKSALAPRVKCCFVSKKCSHFKTAVRTDSRVGYFHFFVKTKVVRIQDKNLFTLLAFLFYAWHFFILEFSSTHLRELPWF